jgi:hypothetical protein
VRIEHLITVLNKGKDKKAKRKWPVDPSERSKLLTRRVDNRVYINYYDLGAYADGSDVPFCITPTITGIAGPNSDYFNANPYHLVHTAGIIVSPDPPYNMRVNFFASPVGFSLDGIDYADTLNAHTFGTDPETWAETYRKIDSDDLRAEYNLAFTGGGEYVPNKGWLPDRETEVGGEIAVTQSLIHCSIFSTAPTWASQATLTPVGESKVTNTQDFSAASVDFVLDASCDVFITPAMTFYWGGVGEYVLGEASFNLLNAIYKPMSRENSINVDEWDDMFSSASGSLVFKDSMSVATRDWWWSKATTDPDARHIHFDTDTGIPLGGGVWDPTGVSSQSPSSFPQNYDAHYGNVDASSERPYICVMRFRMPVGVCLAAIKKRDEWFYVWNTNSINYDNATRHIGGFV